MLVDWKEWGPEAFDLAKKENKLVLLDISAVWCHWCHVMDSTSYCDAAVADTIHERFIPVRVDNDRRPDINERYNMGGWPTTVFLTPEGDILTGATYVPPTEMNQLLLKVSDLYRENREKIEQSIAEKAQDRQKVEPRKQPGPLTGKIVDIVTSAVLLYFDPVYGGFGKSQKFPAPEAIDLAFVRWQATSDPNLLAVVEQTLIEMAKGEIHDKEEGGFFRYSTQPDWDTPHYEKMSDGNAGILRNYLWAYAILGRQEYASVVRHILSYVDATLRDAKNGWFYGSQDADEEYYKLPLNERRQREAPHVDRILYVNWNAMLASSLALASVILQEPKYLDYSRQSVQQIDALCWSEKQGLAHFYDGEPHYLGLLTDHAHYLRAVLDLYQVTGERNFLDKAESLSQFIRRKFTADAPSYSDLMKANNGIGELRHPVKSLVENSVMADNLLRLGRYLNDESLKNQAAAVLAQFIDSYAQYGYFGSAYALAVDSLLQSPLELTIVGSRSDATTELLAAECLRLPVFAKIVQRLDPQTDAELLKRKGLAGPDAPAVHICQGQKCLALARSVEELRSGVREILASEVESKT